MLEYEIKRIPDLQRRRHALEMLALSDSVTQVNDAAEQRARELQKQGIKPLDALHLAVAEEADADYFCSCDDRLIKRAQTLPLKTRPISPLQLIQELDL